MLFMLGSRVEQRSKALHLSARVLQSLVRIQSVSHPASMACSLFPLPLGHNTNGPAWLLVASSIYSSFNLCPNQGVELKETHSVQSPLFEVLNHL